MPELARASGVYNGGDGMAKREAEQTIERKALSF